MSENVKRLFLDVETTGLSPVKNGIIEIAMIMDINGKSHEYTFKCRPLECDQVTACALKVTGVSLEQINEWTDPKEVKATVCKILSNAVNTFDNKDKFFLYAYNSPFDAQFLRNWFTKQGDPFYGSYFFHPDICIMRMAMELLIEERSTMENFALKTVATHVLGSPENTDWHNPLTDVRIARKLYYYLKGEAVYCGR